ncbi:MAG: phosphate acetyltransferase [Sedimentisphaerales bacterium]|nr:phosphate acetyltransferase [Sedimentisphaerales bacterium]
MSTEKFRSMILAKAASNVKHIVLPEGSDPRMIEAAKIVTQDKVAKVTLLGDVDKISSGLKAIGAPLDQIAIIDPKKSERLEGYANGFYELRKDKGMTPEKALEILKDEMYFGMMMLKNDDVDGLVAGAVHSSSDTIRPALQIIKSAKGIKTISSMFFMCRGEETYLFSDCGLIIDPTAEELSDIAFSTANTARQFGLSPKVAMLSYSTKGSAGGAGQEKMVKATELATAKLTAEFGSEFAIDGELQFDAAFVPSVAASKSPDSKVKGQANVFIFPDLGAGNICYKVTQRLGGFSAYGPILQGVAKPVNDLSRGCTASDIVATIAITAIQGM